MTCVVYLLQNVDHALFGKISQSNSVGLSLKIVWENINKIRINMDLSIYSYFQNDNTDKVTSFKRIKDVCIVYIGRKKLKTFSNLS